jgi:hypothetical protein
MSDFGDQELGPKGTHGHKELKDISPKRPSKKDKENGKS